jgi:hypothetical protein
MKNDAQFLAGVIDYPEFFTIDGTSTLMLDVKIRTVRCFISGRSMDYYVFCLP